MFPLTLDDIKNLAGVPIYSRGLTYYQKGSVHKFNIDTEEEETIVTAKVTGRRIYEVDLFLEHRTGQVSGHCSCPAAEMMDTCKHMTAVLIKAVNAFSHDDMLPYETDPLVNRATVSYDPHVSESFTEEIISQLTDEQDPSFHPEIPLTVQFTIKPDVGITYWNKGTFSLRLKAGTNSKLYVVKNAKDFLESIAEKRNHYFTPYFTYDPSEHYIAEPLGQFLQLLKEISDHNDWYGEDHYRYSSKKDEINIPPMFSQQTIDHLLTLEEVYVQDDRDFFPLQVKERTFPLLFYVKKENDYIVLSLSDSYKILTSLEGTDFIMDQGIFYKVNEELQFSAFSLYKAIKKTRSSSMALTRPQFEKIAGTVIPILEKYNLILLDQNIMTNIQTEKCNPVVDIEKDGSQLLARLSFQYGRQVIYPFEEREDQEVLIARDMKTERKVVSLIEEAYFHWNGSRLSLNGDENIGRFFYRILPDLRKHATVTLSDEAEEMIAYELPDSVLTFDIDPSNQWFEVSFRTDDISGDEIESILSSLKEKKHYHTTKEGKIMSLDQDHWKDTLHFLERTGLHPESLADGPSLLPKYQALEADELAKGKGSFHRSQAFETLVQSILHPETTEHRIPASLNAELRDYQLRGFQWLKSLSHYGFGGILADDMGLGKTVQALSFILSEQEEKKTGLPFLVVTPSSLLYNWEREGQTFSPSLRIKVIAGSKEERKEMLSDLTDTDVCITSYPLLRRDTDLYEPLSFQGLLLDEAQTFKNHASQTFKAIKKVKAAQAFALSGTPIENRMEELWSLMAVVMPGLFPDRTEFKKVSLDTIHRKAAPFVLRRTKKEVLTELPDKIEQTRYSELTKEQRKLYLAYLERIQSETMQQLSTEGFQKSRMQILGNLTRLRQLCCHPSLFINDYEGESGKMEELMSILEESLANQSRILIFSQFTTMLSLIGEACEKEEISYFYLDGSTPSRERLELASRFNNGEKEVFLISLKAGGTGLNLTGADTVILYDLWWNPAVETQAADRAHRMGQKQVVQVLKMVTKGTIEEKIQALQEKKKSLFDNLIQSGETNLTSLSEEDIRDILSL
ncbi:SNF2 helicase associated domain-containing protein [Thalassorhabdus alkalitolerans]|uniref:SNF2 helicase associated domain-containing protein n=1 Tax=Thalassorhabdus alkalitolerans TaxID=2282697 RepID=A0ABW0YNP0_9BACI